MPELFQTYDERGRALELVERTKVHASGLWHRSSIVYLFHPDGRMYVQRRAAAKDLYENLLDHSVGEHLIPGETYLQGGHRGLQEELGVAGVDLLPIGGERRLRIDYPQLGIKDFEIQQAFRGVYDGTLEVDPVEVSEVRLYTLEQLVGLIEKQPGSFTPWFAGDLVEFGFLPPDHRFHLLPSNR